MVQKNINWKIIELLKSESRYVRELAELINTNHVQIIRELKNLYDDNIVDYVVKGKNKNYYLKDNLITRKRILLAEDHKFEQWAKKHKLLIPLISKLLNHAKNKIVILFGSYVKSREHEESDIDLFIETKDKKLRDIIQDVDSRFSIKIGEFKKSMPLGKEILKDHIILKGTEAFYEKHKIFEEIAFGK